MKPPYLVDDKGDILGCFLGLQYCNIYPKLASFWPLARLSNYVIHDDRFQCSNDVKSGCRREIKRETSS